MHSLNFDHGFSRSCPSGNIAETLMPNPPETELVEEVLRCPACLEPNKTGEKCDTCKREDNEL